MAAATSTPTTPDSPTEPKARFFRYFQHEVTGMLTRIGQTAQWLTHAFEALQEEMERLSEVGVSGGERSDGVEHCLAGIARLSNEVHDWSGRIPAYDLRTYDEAIKALSDKLQKTRASFAPRPKFTFKTALRTRSYISPTSPKHERGRPEIRVEEIQTNGTNGVPKSAPAVLNGDTQDAVNGEEKKHGVFDGNDPVNKQLLTSKQGIHQPDFAGSSSISIANHEDLHIALPLEASKASSTGTVNNITRCVVDLSAPTKDKPLSSLTLKDIKESLIVCGHVDGPTHITGLKKTIVVVACRQLRIHDCKDCNVYVHCASRPIIERCTGIGFAPLPEVYTTNEQRETENKFDQVDDFNWLQAEHSPNWRVLPEAERADEKIWKDKIPETNNSSPQDVLKATKVFG
ncbi:MAG: hypothetical protein M1820_003889 [Bogoriella megaspora]|nr:MAG: hypothetical protein M1820_003889 [Bogoriella megaspora]